MKTDSRFKIWLVTYKAIMFFRELAKQYPKSFFYLSGTAISAFWTLGESMHKNISRSDSPNVFTEKVVNHVILFPFVYFCSLPWPVYAGKVVYDKVSDMKTQWT